MNQLSLDQQFFDTGENLPQKVRILNSLKNASSWVCGTTFQRMFIPTYSQRINIDLKKDGHTILSKPCDIVGHSHRGNVAMYYLLKESTK